jgi:hypothetical protein
MSGAGMLLDPGDWPNAGPEAKAPSPSAPKAAASKRFRIMSVPLFIRCPFKASLIITNFLDLAASYNLRLFPPTQTVDYGGILARINP